MSDSDPDRQRKLQAGREKLLQFQQRKKRKKREEEASKSSKRELGQEDNRSEGQCKNATSLRRSPKPEATQDKGDQDTDHDAASIASSLDGGSHPASPLQQEGDQHSYTSGSEYTSGDESYSYSTDDGGVNSLAIAHLEVNELKNRVVELEETLRGKQTVLKELNKENFSLKSKLQDFNQSIRQQSTASPVLHHEVQQLQDMLRQNQLTLEGMKQENNELRSKLLHKTEDKSDSSVIEELKENLASKQATLLELNRQNQELAKENNALRKSITEKNDMEKSELENLQEAIKSKSLIISELNEQNKELRNKMEILSESNSSELLDYKHKYELAVKDMMKLQQDLDKNQSLQSELLKTKERLSDAQHNLSAQTKELSLIGQQFNNKCVELEENRRNYKKLHAEMESTKKQSVHHLSQIKEHEGHIHHLEAEIQNQLTKSDALESQLAIAIGERDAVQLEANTQIEDLTDQIKLLQQELQKNMDAIKTQENRVQSGTEELNRAQALVTELRVKIKKQVEENDTLKRNLEKTLKSKHKSEKLVEDYLREMSSLKGNLQAKQLQIFDLNSKLDKTLNELQSTRNDYQERITELEDLVNYKEDEVANVMNDLEQKHRIEMEAASKDFVQRIAGEQEKWELELSEKVQALNETHRQRETSLLRQIETMQKVKEEEMNDVERRMSEELHSLRSHVAELTCDLESERGKVNIHLSELSTVRAELQFYKQTNSMLENEVSSLQEETGRLAAKADVSSQKEVEETIMKVEEQLVSCASDSGVSSEETFTQHAQDILREVCVMRCRNEESIANTEDLEAKYLNLMRENDVDDTEKGDSEKSSELNLEKVFQVTFSRLRLELKKLQLSLEERDSQSRTENESLRVVQDNKLLTLQSKVEDLLALKKDMESSVEAYRDELDAMRQQSDHIKDNYEKNLEQLQSAFENDMRELENENHSLKEGLAQAKEQFAREMSSAAGVKQEALLNLQENLETKMTTLKSELVTEHEQELQRVLGENRKEISELLVKHQVEIDELTEELEKRRVAELSLLRQQFEEDKDREVANGVKRMMLEQANNAELLRLELQEQLLAIREENEQELNAIREQYKSTSKEGVTETEDVLLDQIEKLQDEYSLLQKRFNQCKEELETVNSENSTIQTKLSNVNSLLSDQVEDIRGLSKEKETWKKSYHAHERFLWNLCEAVDVTYDGQTTVSQDEIPNLIFGTILARIEEYKHVIGGERNIEKSREDGYHTSTGTYLIREDAESDDADNVDGKPSQQSLRSFVVELQDKLKRATREKEELVSTLRSELDISNRKVNDLEEQLDYAQSFGNISTLNLGDQGGILPLEPVASPSNDTLEASQFTSTELEEPVITPETASEVNMDRDLFNDSRDSFNDIVSQSGVDMEDVPMLGMEDMTVDSLVKQIKYLERLLVEKNQADEAQRHQIKTLTLEMENERKMFAQQLRLRQEKELSQSMQDLQFTFGGGRGLALKTEYALLEQKLKEKERIENELKVENARLVRVVKENNMDLIKEKDTLQQQLLKQEEIIQELHGKMSVSSVVTDELQEAFGRQLSALHNQRDSLLEKLDQQKANHEGFAKVIQEKAALEESLRNEKELLKEKLNQKEALERDLAVERLALQDKLIELEKLREVLVEKDKMATNLEEQRDELQMELDNIEQKLIMKEVQLSTEKEELENELSRKEVELTSWESKFAEREGKYSEDIDILRKQHRENLESTRLTLERTHHDNLRRLRMELDEDYQSRMGTMENGYADQMGRMRDEHREQVPYFNSYRFF